MNDIDLVRLNFNPQSLWALNAIIGLVMFGVALDLKVSDFRGLLTAPKPVAIGMIGQFVLLPAVSFLLVLAIRPAPSIALGMMLVAACPGGNISNFLTHYARGNTALSITMTALSTVVAIVMTPLNPSLWGGLHPETNRILHVVALDPLDMLMAVLLLLGLPMAAGLPERDRRAVSIEVGIQNSALGLILIFNFFGGLGGMAIVTAWWGIWHIVSGLTVATIWSRRPPQTVRTA